MRAIQAEEIAESARAIEGAEALSRAHRAFQRRSTKPPSLRNPDEAADAPIEG